MSDDRPLAALLILAGRGSARGADAVHLAATVTPPAGVPGAAPEGSRGGRLALRITMAILVIALLGGALIATGLVPGRSLVTRVADEILGSNEGPYDDQLDEWLAGYDPAERQYLKDTTEPGFGFVSKQYEVGTLEFRRTCRKLAAALEAANAPEETDRSAAVYEIMGPQLERNDERDRIGALADGSQPLGPGQGSMWEAWHRMTAEVAAGNEANARSFIEHNCTHGTLLPWVDE